MHWTARHDLLLFAAALAFGVLVLPFLVHQTGVRVFGAYAGGGALGFLGDYLRSLVAMRWHAWSLALGPLVVVAIWRALWSLSAPRAAAGRG